MAAPVDHPDDAPWWSPEVAAELGGVHENTVLYYFQRSPFCDPTSNNVVVFNQCLNTVGMQERLANRESFAQTVAQLPGIEYVVHLSMRDTSPGAGDPPPGQGHWVLRKQRRSKRPGQPDTLETLATYFIIGQLVFQAPSLADILWARLLSASDAMLKITATLEKQHGFVPAHGHRWFHPTLAAPPANKTQAAASRAASPTPSDTASMAGGGAEDARPGAAADDSGIATAAALRESFAQFLRYSGDYMDENPLAGEPGAFVFSNSAQAVQKRREDAERALHEREEDERRARERALEMALAVKRAQAAADTGTPRDVEKVKNEGRERRASGAGRPRIKRKKSRAPGSPTSPLSGAASPMAMSPADMSPGMDMSPEQ